MASVRRLKKDINYIVSEIIVECFAYDYLFPDKNNDEIAKTISDALRTQQEIIKKINQLKYSKNQSGKAYKEIRKEFADNTKAIIEKLDNLS